MPSETADRLADAALLAVRRHGYAGTGIQDLLRETGVSSSSMYHFFPGGKEELVASAVRTSGLTSAALIADVFERREPAAAIQAIFDAAAAEMQRHDFALGCPIGVPATEAPADSTLIRAAVAEVFAAWTAAYSAGLQAGGVDEDVADSLGRAIVAVYQGSVTVARATGSVQPYQDAAAVLINQLPS